MLARRQAAGTNCQLRQRRALLRLGPRSSEAGEEVLRFGASGRGFCSGLRTALPAPDPPGRDRPAPRLSQDRTCRPVLGDTSESAVGVRGFTSPRNWTPFCCESLAFLEICRLPPPGRTRLRDQRPQPRGGRREMTSRWVWPRWNRSLGVESGGQGEEGGREAAVAGAKASHVMEAGLGEQWAGPEMLVLGVMGGNGASGSRRPRPVGAETPLPASLAEVRQKPQF
ncbi:uncharacterized protein LOC127556916 [Antechinus flavipes]|uniref:uncharacterized protein LOC127556916 n=1 Tax=Antechinus flavipes TaxID=38775 RepID=UPI002235FD77|nr:uncharacterized protein LOC127556916 [Antechinus flavipes]